MAAITWKTTVMKDLSEDNAATIKAIGDGLRAPGQAMRDNIADKRANLMSARNERESADRMLTSGLQRENTKLDMTKKQFDIDHAGELLQSQLMKSRAYNQSVMGGMTPLQQEIRTVMQDNMLPGDPDGKIDEPAFQSDMTERGLPYGAGNTMLKSYKEGNTYYRNEANKAKITNTVATAMEKKKAEAARKGEPAVKQDPSINAPYLSLPWNTDADFRQKHQQDLALPLKYGAPRGEAENMREAGVHHGYFEKSYRTTPEMEDYLAFWLDKYNKTKQAKRNGTAPPKAPQ